MENPIKIDDLGVPLFLETPIYIYILYIQKEGLSLSDTQNLGEVFKLNCRNLKDWKMSFVFSEFCTFHLPSDKLT